MFSRLPGKVSRYDVDFVSVNRKFSRLAGKLCSYETKIISVTEISPVSKRELGTRENFRLIWTQSNFSYYFITRRDLACKLAEMFSR